MPQRNDGVIAQDELVAVAAPELAAKLTNHIIPPVILTPGVVATVRELTAAGLSFMK